MNPATPILDYLAECYRENGSRVGVTNLDASRVRLHHFLEGEDAIVSESILDGQFFVPGKKAAKLATEARLREKDCTLYYGSVFLCGMFERGSESRKPAFAPLILYPVSSAKSLEESGAEFTIETDRRLLNYALLEALGDDDFIEKVENAIDRDTHGEGCVGELRRLFSDSFPEARADRLLGYPHLLAGRELREVREGVGSCEREGLHLLPVAALFLADKSREMRGVLNDLRAMAEAKQSPACPVEHLLSLEPTISLTGGRPPKKRLSRIPAYLSPAQEAIVTSARWNPITLAVGPPGTGKSFTIAALAIDTISRGGSVLVCSKMDHAVDVVGDLIEKQLGFPGLVVRGGRKNYLKQLKDFLEELLAGMHTRDAPTKKEILAARSGLQRLHKEIDSTERGLERSSRAEEKSGRLLSRRDPGFFTKLRQGWARKRTEKSELLCRASGRLTELLDRRLADTVEFLRNHRRWRLAAELDLHRETFQAFSKAIRARSSHKQEEYFGNVFWLSLLEALPIWLVNLSDLHRVLPMEREMFDLVIIDEASQCDIASVLPAMQRAQRAVVTGDPKQLRHVSFLPVARQREFARRHGLTDEQVEQFDFRRTSLVDLASQAIDDQACVVFLNEHYRSRPEIIAFSNREFYADQLAVMTGHRERDRDGSSPLSVIRVDGVRGENGVNEVEIDAVFAELDQLVVIEPPLSIGILSPFRDQVDAILARIEQRSDVNRLLDRHDLLAGTAHSFQGEERDVMLLSLALDDASPSASFRFLAKPDVFNVSITRARLWNRVFVSFDPGRSPDGIVSRYLAFAAGEGSGSGTNRVRSTTQADFAKASSARQGWVELRAELERRDWEIEEEFQLGGYTIDLVARKDCAIIGIDLIGFPGPHAEGMSMQRHLLFRRAGIRLFPLAYAEWLVRRDEVLGELEGMLES